MNVIIRHAKIVHPLSESHHQFVDLNIQFDSFQKIEKITINNSVGQQFASIENDGEKVWSAETNNNILYISPGFVDVFADYREPGFEHKETITSGLKAAAAGGFTDVFLIPNTQPTISTKSVVEYVQQKAKNHVVSLHAMGSITQDIEGKNLAEMMDMNHHGAKAFTDGWKPVQSNNLMLKALEYVKAFDGILLQIPLDASMAAGGLMHEGEISTSLGMAGIPVLAETILLHRDLELVRYTGSKLHVTGISTAAGVEMIRAAKQEGLQVTCSVTPYHLLLTDTELTTYDSLYKVSPVLRSETDRQALIEGLKDGTIDCIASHHRPQEWDAKAKEFEYANDGMSVQEICFPLLLKALTNEVSIERLIDAIAIRPRTIFGLPIRFINEDSNGSFTLFSCEDTTTLTQQNQQSISSNNPFLGQTLPGKVIGIVNQKQINFNL